MTTLWLYMPSRVHIVVQSRSIPIRIAAHMPSVTSMMAGECMVCVWQAVQLACNTIQEKVHEEAWQKNQACPDLVNGAGSTPPTIDYRVAGNARAAPSSWMPAE